MNKLTVIFKKDIEKIQNKDLSQVVNRILDKCPDYIATIASSSTGKYHPPDEICEQGMIIHIKRCLGLVDQVCRMFNFEQRERDILIASCILHDVLKNGDPPENHTVDNHAKLMYDKIGSIYNSLPIPENEILDGLIFDLRFCVLLHGGRWSTPEETKEYTEWANFTNKKLIKAMHLIDFFASRREIYDFMQKEWVGNIKEEVCKLTEEKT